MTSGVKVITIGKSFPLPYEVLHIADSAQILPAIARFRPDVIVTSTFTPGQLISASFDIRKRWIHVPVDSEQKAIIAAIENCYSFNLWSEHQYEKDNPLVSVFTGTWNTGNYLRDTYQSLREQSYPTWEWVVMDDHSDDGTWERLLEIAKEDIRVRPFRSGTRLGKIGAVKDAATRLCKGAYLVELDHDDMLTDFALAEIKDAFIKNPNVGFVYSNCSNFFENGTFHRFTDAFWKPRYRETEYRGKKWVECLQPDIYDRYGPHFADQFGWYLTVGPNHVRCFRSKTFQELGGYNPNLLVADDWDLYARFFLKSNALLIDKMLYLYRFKDNWANTTFTRNQAIQDHLSLGRARYAAEFERKNAERLKDASAAAAPAVNTNDILLTVGVCMTPQDLTTGSMPTVHELLRQAKGKRAEILCMLEEDPTKFGEKRNALIEGANGRFVSFVDTDGQIESDYVSSILEAIETSPESDCIVFDVLVHGRSPQPKVCKYDSSQLESEGSLYFYRKPDQTMVWRKDVAQENHYSEGQAVEMTDWADKASKCIKKQLRIQKTLYHTLHDPVGKTRLVLPPPEVSQISTTASHTKTLSDVSFIILEAVTSELTVRCLESIRKWAKDSEIILVANGCIPLPGAAAYADKIERLDTNLGFAAGCNAGAMVATKPIVCFMNNDATFVDETPEKLVSAISATHPIVAPFSNRAKPPQGDRARSETPTSDMFPDMVVGLCMMLPKDLYKELGGFDPRLLTYEDDELCQKARLKGKLCKVVGGTWVEHERHATFKALGLDPQEVMNRNRIVFGLKNPVIRVIVIAKDEEKAIDGFFSQFRWITDDWCLLDTGSTDRTVEVAKSLGVRVETAPLKDFASARNEAIERFGEGADWIVMFDPDERLDEHTLQHFRELVYPGRHDIYLAPLYATYPDGSKRDFVAKPFLFRNMVNIRWIFKVHEKLIGSDRQALVKNASINHVIALHEDGRRQKAAGMYDALMKAEPYFTDPKYKEEILKKWPILDYDRPDDPRIVKIYTGPLISVVIPTFKRTSLLNKAIVSALYQDYENLEIIVVGDACPELDTVFTGSHSRIRAYNLSSNHGAGGAVPRNHAIKAAAGRLIAYLDDDNEWKPNHVSSVYEAMRIERASFGFSSMEVAGKDLGFTEPKYQGIDTSCVIHLKNLVEKYGGWKDRIEGGYAHDWEFISRWVKGGEPWVSTEIPTLIYNAETSGQAGFLKAVAAEKQT